MSTGAQSARDILNALRGGFELVEDRPGLSFIQFPLRWRSGDWLPIALRRTPLGWQLTDDAWHYPELSSGTDSNFYKGRAGERFSQALLNHSLRMEEGAIVRDIAGDEDWPSAYADFVHGLFAIEEVVHRIPERRRRPRANGAATADIHD